MKNQFSKEPMSKHILVTGAGGFIGGHLVAKLLQDGHRVRAVDRKPQWQWYQRFPDAENMTLNLEEKEGCLTAVMDAIGSIIWPPTWAGWDLSNLTRASACLLS